MVRPRGLSDRLQFEALLRCCFTHRPLGRGRLFSFFFLMIRRPPRSTLFPSTTPFRSSLWTRTTGLVSCSPPGRRARSHSTRSEEHTSELQSLIDLVCRLLLEKKKR